MNCLQCGEHKVNPKYGPFCTQWCAAYYGIEMAQDYRCCRKCGEWRRIRELPCEHGTEFEYTPISRMGYQEEGE